MRKMIFKLPLAVKLGALCAAVLFALPIAPVSAEEHGRAQGEPRGHYQFRERDVHRFAPHEARIWRGGVWRHEWRNGRLGWWWFTGGVWYFYERPVYPFPLVVSEIAFADPMVVTSPPPAIIAPGAPMIVQQPPPASPAPVQMWYYCDNPAGYYPYVATCQTPFRPVPATPH